MRSIRILCTAVIATVLLSTPISYAASVTFDSPGDSADFFYSGDYDGAHLEATIVLTLTSWLSNRSTFTVSATNSSSGAGTGLNPNRLVAFGVQVVNPDLAGADVPGATEWDASINTNFPGFGSVELCAFAGPVCSGGAGLGVYVGQTDTFDLVLTFTSLVGPTSPIRFDSPFPSKWQSVGTTGRSVEFDDDLICSTACSPSTVPEPASLALLGLGLAGLAANRKRNRPSPTSS